MAALAVLNSPSAPKRASVSGLKATIVSSPASSKEMELSRPRRANEGRRRSSSADEYEGRLELLVFGPNSKQQLQHHVLMKDKALKFICSSNEPVCGIEQQEFDFPDCSFGFNMQHGDVHVTSDDDPAVPTSADSNQSIAVPLQFYTSPASLHSGIAIDGGSPLRSSRSLSPGTHVRISVLQRVELAPELEHALMYCYLASMPNHSVDVDTSAHRAQSSQLPLAKSDASSECGILDIGTSNERFRVKAPALRVHGTKIPLRQPLQDELDFSEGVLAVATSHEVRHCASGSCMLTIGGDGDVLVIPPPPRIERLYVAASAQSVEAVRQQERAQTFCIHPSTYLGSGQEGMVTCVASSSDKIKLGVNACVLDNPSLTCAYVIEFGPFNPKLPWGEQISTVERKQHEFHDEQRLKRGIAYSSGASVSQISCGESFSIAKMSDGSLWSWGGCQYGSLGHGPSVDSLLKPKKIACGVLRFASVSCGAHHVGALCSSHELYMWGSNHQGQLGIAKEKDSSEKLWLFSKDKDSAAPAVWLPTKVTLSVLGLGALGAQQVSCGYYHTALLTTTGVPFVKCLDVFFLRMALTLLRRLHFGLWRQQLRSVLRLLSRTKNSLLPTSHGD
jgi:hypothetical protein